MQYPVYNYTVFHSGSQIVVPKELVYQKNKTLFGIEVNKYSDSNELRDTAIIADQAFDNDYIVNNMRVTNLISSANEDIEVLETNSAL